MSATAPGSSSTTVYRIVSRTHVNQWDNALQAAVPGWELRVLWVKTGTVLAVFVADASYTPENVDAQIRHLGGLDEQIHALGS